MHDIHFDVDNFFYFKTIACTCKENKCNYAIKTTIDRTKEDAPRYDSNLGELAKPYKQNIMSFIPGGNSNMSNQKETDTSGVPKKKSGNSW